MDESENGGTLAERVERLEARVEEQGRELRRVVRRLEGLPAGEEPALRERRGRVEERATITPPAEEAPEPRTGMVGWETTSRGSSDWSGLPFDLGDLRSGEWWLNKVGIALVFLGVAFLFKLSVDRGWITPAVRVGFGLATGLGLIIVGLRVHGERRAFGQVLIGGGIGALYVTGFAAYALYALVPHAAAFGFMVAVTLLSFVLSLRQDGAALALIGTIGGLATPFVLPARTDAVGGLVLYVSLILAGAAAIYLYKGWRSLLLISYLGTWTVFLLALAYAASPPGPVPTPDAVSLQLGVLFAWLVLGVVPVAREILRSRDPASWPLPEPGAFARELFGDEDLLRSSAPAYLLSVATPLLALAFTQGIWDLGWEALGWTTLGGAALYALAGVALRPVEGGSRAAYAQALTALLLATLALVLLLDGDALLFALAAEAVALHFLAARLSDKILSLEAHALALISGLWLVSRLTLGTAENAFGLVRPELFNAGSLTDLAVICLSFVASVTAAPPSARRGYVIFGHAALLAWVLRGFVGQPDGETWVLLLWALYAAGLHLLTSRRPRWSTLRGGYALWAVVVLLLGARLMLAGVPEVAVFNLRGLADLAVILLAALISFSLSSRRAALAYRLAAHLALLAWLWRELSALPGPADAYVTVAWGLYAAGLLVAGLRLDHAWPVRAGMGTLLLVVAKLLLVDLAQVEALWRVLLFLGFGGLFLVLSYYLRSLWRPQDGQGSRVG